MSVFLISVFPACCRTRWGDSRLSEEHRLPHLRASAQVPHGFSQGGGAEVGPVVRLITLPNSLPKSPCRVESTRRVFGLIWVQFIATSYHPFFFFFFFNEIYWHLVWEGDPVPSDDPRSYHLHGNRHAAPWPAFSCPWVLLSDLLNDVVLYLTHTHTQTVMHEAC